MIDEPEPMVSQYHHDRAVERLEQQIRQLANRVQDLERNLSYKADDRHDHREYAPEHHYH